jgi:hypothetical protein
LTRPSTIPAKTPPRPGRARWIENLAVVWWVAGAAFAVVDAIAYRASAGAAVLPTVMRDHDLLGDVPARYMTVAVAALAVLGALMATWQRWRPAGARAARGLMIAAAVLVLVGAVVLVDSTVLAGLGYLPAMLIVSTFNAEARANLVHYVEPEFLFQLALLVGAVLLATATVRFARRTVAACETCGRRFDGVDPAWTTPEAAARWGKVAALVAAAAPAFYAVTRLAWALGIPLGFPREMVEQFQGIKLIGPVGLGSFALLGAVLTLGLYQRWGERFPRWMIGLAGKRVPVRLAVIPATIVAAAVLPAGITLIVVGARSGLLTLEADSWGAVGPGLLWPLWSVALGAATYAYWLRRRGRCAVCGRG